MSFLIAGDTYGTLDLAKVVQYYEGRDAEFSKDEDYTDDEMALELAGLIEKFLSGIKPDEQFVEGIKKIWKKVICAGGVFCEEK